MMVTAFYAALAAAMLIFLSIRVVNARRDHGVSVGAQGEPELERAMRVHGNFIEYAPLGLLMLALAELQGLPAWAAHLFGAALIAGRVIHFQGFKSPQAPGRLRVLGMLITFGVLAALALVLIAQYAMGFVGAL